ASAAVSSPGTSGSSNTYTRPGTPSQYAGAPTTRLWMPSPSKSPSARPRPAQPPGSSPTTLTSAVAVVCRPASSGPNHTYTAPSPVVGGDDGSAPYHMFAITRSSIPSPDTSPIS